MPLSKEENADRVRGNPFRSWWERGDDAWRAERLRRWPQVNRSLHRYLDDAGAQMADFKKYYLDGTPCPGLRGYIQISMRLAMLPFESMDEARQAIEANTSRSERVLRRQLKPSLLGGASIHLEGLPVDRHGDEGIRKLCWLGEAAFPEAFTAADAESSDPMDPAYFLEHGRGSSAKPLPFVNDYQRLGSRFMQCALAAKGRRALVNPCDQVREYYLSCLRYIEAVDRSFDPEDDGYFQESLTEFLTEILYFDILNPETPADRAAAHFARGWRERLDCEDLPVVMAAERDRLLADPPTIEPRPAPPPENRFAHLRFFSDARTEYKQGYTPDADSRVEAIVRFAEEKERDVVVHMIGEPGRPADRSVVESSQQGLFDAIEILPLPYRVRHAGETGLYVEFVDWHYAHQSIQPLLNALKVSQPELAYVTFSMIEEDGSSGCFEVQRDQVSEARRPRGNDESTDSLWQAFRRLSECD